MERFLARSRQSYAQDLAPLLAQVGAQPVPALTHPTAATFLAAQEHLAASTFNRRYAALRSFVRWCQQQGWLEEDALVGMDRRPQPRVDRGRWTPSKLRPCSAGFATCGIGPCSG